MSTARLYFATNRKHKGNDRWHPDSYGGGFSSNGHHNLRFGKLDLTVDDAEVKKSLDGTAHGRKGNGEELAKYLTRCVDGASIEAYKDDVGKLVAHEEKASTRVFRDLKIEMEKVSDVLVFIHGFNVSWEEAVGSALALQYMLNRKSQAEKKEKDIIVVLFTWPSDGSMMPFAAYWSDRNDAEESGPAVGRALLKLHEFLSLLRKGAKRKEEELCRQEIHLLCHSMGNYVLQHSLSKMIEYLPGQRLPRLFGHIFLCAADVDDDVLESRQPMERLHELALNVSAYFNNGDVALHVSDATKGLPDRLGQTGVAHDSLVHRKVHQIDCSPIVRGMVEHSYFLWATVNEDISMSIHEEPFGSGDRKRTEELRNSWVMK